MTLTPRRVRDMDGELALDPRDACRFCQIVKNGGGEKVLAVSDCDRFIVVVPNDGDEDDRLVISTEHVRDGMQDPALYGAAQIFAMEYARDNMALQGERVLVFQSDVAGFNRNMLHFHVRISSEGGTRSAAKPAHATGSRSCD